MKIKKKTIRCPYCGRPAILRDASYVYGSNSYGGKVYVCNHYPVCDSYVGVLSGTNLPKGSLAYRWLAEKFCLERCQAHIGEFSDYMCDQLIQEASKVLKNNHVPLRMAG